MPTTAEELAARTIDEELRKNAAAIPKRPVSVDSRVNAPADRWKDSPQNYRDQSSEIEIWPFDKRHQGGLNPDVRSEHVEVDGAAAELPYPTATLRELLGRPRSHKRRASKPTATGSENIVRLFPGRPIDVSGGKVQGASRDNKTIPLISERGDRANSDRIFILWH